MHRPSMTPIKGKRITQPKLTLTKWHQRTAVRRKSNYDVNVSTNSPKILWRMKTRNKDEQKVEYNLFICVLREKKVRKMFEVCI